jgi:hypothetical protein
MINSYEIATVSDVDLSDDFYVFLRFILLEILNYLIHL